VRHYRVADDSNRLLQTWHGGDGTEPVTNVVTYRYDTHGNMLNLADVAPGHQICWDYRDMIHAINLVGGGWVFYNYDSEKQRTRKRIERQDGIIEDRWYLGGMEYYRHSRGTEVLEEIETFHLFADDQRVLLVDDVLRTDNADLGTGTLYRYQYSNHLGSVGLELDADGNVISYEEYHPYGTSAYRASGAGVRATAKQYRYTGMERDEETGLSYHSARYCAVWMGRWISADPIGIEGGMNSFSYSWGNPVMQTDPSGEQPVVAHRMNFIDPETSLSRSGDYFPETGVFIPDESGSNPPSDAPSNASVSPSQSQPRISMEDVPRIAEEARATLEIEFEIAGMAGNDARFDELIDDLASAPNEYNAAASNGQLDGGRIINSLISGLGEGLRFGALAYVGLLLAPAAAVPIIVGGLVVLGVLGFVYSLFDMTVQAANGNRQGATETLAGMAGNTAAGLMFSPGIGRRYSWATRETITEGYSRGLADLEQSSPTGSRPGTVNVIAVEGGYYEAYSVRGEQAPNLAAEVTEILDNIPPPERGAGHGRCGECQNMTNIIREGVSPRGGYSSSRIIRSRGNPNHAQSIPACRSCAQVLRHHGVRQ
jgi:RHS repeat-associated protein